MEDSHHVVNTPPSGDEGEGDKVMAREDPDSSQGGGEGSGDDDSEIEELQTYYAPTSDEEEVIMKFYKEWEKYKSEIISLNLEKKDMTEQKKQLHLILFDYMKVNKLTQVPVEVNGEEKYLRIMTIHPSKPLDEENISTTIKNLSDEVIEDALYKIKSSIMKEMEKERKKKRKLEGAKGKNKTNKKRKKTYNKKNDTEEDGGGEVEEVKGGKDPQKEEKEEEPIIQPTLLQVFVESVMENVRRVCVSTKEKVQITKSKEKIISDNNNNTNNNEEGDEGDATLEKEDIILPKDIKRCAFQFFNLSNGIIEKNRETKRLNMTLNAITRDYVQPRSNKVPRSKSALEEMNKKKELHEMYLNQRNVLSNYLKRMNPKTKSYRVILHNGEEIRQLNMVEKESNKSRPFTREDFKRVVQSVVSDLLVQNEIDPSDTYQQEYNKKILDGEFLEVAKKNILSMMEEQKKNNQIQCRVITFDRVNNKSTSMSKKNVLEDASEDYDQGGDSDGDDIEDDGNDD